MAKDNKQEKFSSWKEFSKKFKENNGQDWWECVDLTDQKSLQRIYPFSGVESPKRVATFAKDAFAEMCAAGKIVGVNVGRGGEVPTKKATLPNMDRYGQFCDDLWDIQKRGREAFGADDSRRKPLFATDFMEAAFFGGLSYFSCGIWDAAMNKTTGALADRHNYEKYVIDRFNHTDENEKAVRTVIKSFMVDMHCSREWVKEEAVVEAAVDQAFAEDMAKIEKVKNQTEVDKTVLINESTEAPSEQ